MQVRLLRDCFGPNPKFDPKKPNDRATNWPEIVIPKGTIIDHKDAYYLCRGDDPNAEPVDEEAKANFANYVAWKTSVLKDREAAKTVNTDEESLAAIDPPVQEEKPAETPPAEDVKPTDPPAVEPADETPPINTPAPEEKPADPPAAETDVKPVDPPVVETVDPPADASAVVETQAVIEQPIIDPPAAPLVQKRGKK